MQVNEKPDYQVRESRHQADADAADEAVPPQTTQDVAWGPVIVTKRRGRVQVRHGVPRGEGSIPVLPGIRGWREDENPAIRGRCAAGYRRMPGIQASFVQLYTTFPQLFMGKLPHVCGYGRIFRNGKQEIGRLFGIQMAVDQRLGAFDDSLG